MVNKVFASISKALHSKFGDTHYYYVENIEQKVKTPCFTIGALNPIMRSINRKDYRRVIPCVIHYFTDNKTNPIETCYSIGEQALETLEYLNIDGHLVRGEDMSYTMVDDVLEIFITYRFWTEKDQEPLDQMEGVDIATPSVNNN